MARFPSFVMHLILAVLTTLSANTVNAALAPGEIADFSNGLALDTFALKDLINGIAQDGSNGALQDVFEQYNDIIDTLAAQFQYLPGTELIQDGNDQQVVFESYSNVNTSLFAQCGMLAHKLSSSKAFCSSAILSLLAQRSSST